MWGIFNAHQSGDQSAISFWRRVRYRQKQLDAMLASAGTGSVKAAVEDDPTLDGTVENVRVVEVSGYRMYPFPNSSAPLLGAEWLVEVLARGDA